MARTYRYGLAYRLFNEAWAAALRAGLGPSDNYLLTVRGRRTGRPRTTPIVVLEREGVRWLVSPYGERDWAKNARAAGEVVLRRGRQSETVRVEEVSSEVAAPVLREYLTEVPHTRPYFDVQPESTIQDFVAEAPRHPVFRIVASNR